jgi:very-short-patch-repair endonuclease
MSSALEAKFALLWRALNGPKLERELKFHPTRKWRFDFAHTESKIAVEIEGGAWNGGRHTRGSGFVKDAEKYNAAILQGWRVFRLPSNLITAENVQPIVDLLK